MTTDWNFNKKKTYTHVSEKKNRLKKNDCIIAKPV